MAAPSPTTDPAWLPAPTEPFWKPRLRDSVRYLGWRIPLVVLSFFALVALIYVCVHWSQFVWAIALWKFIGIMIAAPIVLSISAMGSALKARPDPFCIHCGYSLEGLPDHHFCPECGRPNSLRLIEEYRRDPAWFIARCKTRLTLPSTYAPFSAGSAKPRRKSRDGAS